MSNTNLPEDFDWKFYLDTYPDLTKAGITTKEGAVRHYLKHGQFENRFMNKLLPENFD